jgi:uncharacterized membrane protein
MEKNRLEGFSDNVFALVATLLIFELKLPEGHSVWQSVEMIEPKILAFVLSFLIVTMYWVAHHTMFDSIVKVDRNLLWLNSLSLLFLTFIPFPTAVLGSHPFEAGAIALYGSTLICVNVMNTAIWVYATRTPGLASEKVNGKVTRNVLLLFLSPVAIYVVAIVAGIYEPRVSLVVFVCVPLFYILPNPLVRRALRAPRE